MRHGVALVVLAGGSGTRTGGLDNKVYRRIAGRPILSYPIEAAAASGLVSRLVVVIRPEDRALAEQLMARYGTGLSASLVIGGTSRHQSEWNALTELTDEIEDASIDVVAIHDGARPFLNVDLLRSLIEAAAEWGGALPGLPLDGVVASGNTIVDTHDLRRVQTPQAFQARTLLDAYRRADAEAQEGVDTAETVIRYSHQDVQLVPGDPHNLKVTYPSDFDTAERAATQWDRGRWNEIAG